MEHSDVNVGLKFDTGYLVLFPSNSMEIIAYGTSWHMYRDVVAAKYRHHVLWLWGVVIHIRQ